MFAILTFSYLIGIMIPICLTLILPKILIECSICFHYYDAYNHLTRPHKRPSYVRDNNERRRMLLLSKIYNRIKPTTTTKDNDNDADDNDNDNDKHREFKSWIISLEKYLSETIESWEQVNDFHINLKIRNDKYKRELKLIRSELKKFSKYYHSKQEIINLIKFLDLVRTFEF